MRAIISHITASLLLLALMCSCGTGNDGYRFIYCDEADLDWEGSYRFTALLDDTLGHYSTSIVARYDSKSLQDSVLTFDITIVAPTGESAVERVCLPLATIEGISSIRNSIGNSRDGKWLWRKNITVGPKEAGLWKIEMTPAGDTPRSAVTGIGLSYKKEN